MNRIGSIRDGVAHFSKKLNTSDGLGRDDAKVKILLENIKVFLLSGAALGLPPRHGRPSDELPSRRLDSRRDAGPDRRLPPDARRDAPRPDRGQILGDVADNNPVLYRRVFFLRQIKED